jgi:hypothetical protein
MAPRSGRNALSIGVGTVTMWKSQAQHAGVGGEDERVLPQIAAVDLAGAVVSLAQFGDAQRIDVVAGHPPSEAGKGDRDGQADIAKSDDADFPLMRHVDDPCAAMRDRLRTAKALAPAPSKPVMQDGGERDIAERHEAQRSHERRATREPSATAKMDGGALDLDPGREGTSLARRQHG